MSRNDSWVSASDAGRAAYCPQYLAHKYAGTDVDRHAKEARAAGDAAHDNLNRRVSQDQRCFVASWAYGSEHPATALLRRWRDTCLQTTPLGRMAIQIYYRLSPIAIWVLARTPGGKPLSAYVLNRIIRLTTKHIDDAE